MSDSHTIEKHLERPSFSGVRQVLITTIPHEDQRYPTVGDWLYDPVTAALEIRVSNTGDWREAMTVAVHELVESLICVQRGIEEEEVSKFDIAYEKVRPSFWLELDDRNLPYVSKDTKAAAKYLQARTVPNRENPPITEDSEPGDDPRAPYYFEHQAATVVEHQMAFELGLHWDTYGDSLMGLFDETETEPESSCGCYEVQAICTTDKDGNIADQKIVVQDKNGQLSLEEPDDHICVSSMLLFKVFPNGEVELEDVTT